MSAWYGTHENSLHTNRSSLHTDRPSAVDFCMDPVVHGTLIQPVVARFYTDGFADRKMALPRPDCSADILMVPRRLGKITVRPPHCTLPGSSVDYLSVDSLHTGRAAVAGSATASTFTGLNLP